jgi:hypothetical protein
MKIPDFTINVSNQLPKFCKKITRIIAEVVGQGVKKYSIKSRLKETVM